MCDAMSSTPFVYTSAIEKTVEAKEEEINKTNSALFSKCKTPVQPTLPMLRFVHYTINGLHSLMTIWILQYLELSFYLFLGLFKVQLAEVSPTFCWSLARRMSEIAELKS